MLLPLLLPHLHFHLPTLVCICLHLSAHSHPCSPSLMPPLICTHLPPFILTCILACPCSGSCLLTLIGSCWWFSFFQCPLSFVHTSSFVLSGLFTQTPPSFMLFGLCCTVTISISTLTCAYLSIFHFCCVLWVEST